MVAAFETLCGLCPPDTDGFTVGLYELGRAWSGSGQLHPTTVARRLGRFQDLGLVTYSIAAGVVTLRLSDPRGVVQRPVGAALGWARRQPPRLGMSAQPQRGLPFVKPEDDHPALGVVGIAGDRRPAENATSGNEDALACVSTDGNARAPTDGNARACVSIPPPPGDPTPRACAGSETTGKVTAPAPAPEAGDGPEWLETREIPWHEMRDEADRIRCDLHLSKESRGGMDGLLLLKAALIRLRGGERQVTKAVSDTRSAVRKKPAAYFTRALGSECWDASRRTPRAEEADPDKVKTWFRRFLKNIPIPGRPGAVKPASTPPEAREPTRSDGPAADRAPEGPISCAEIAAFKARREAAWKAEKAAATVPANLNPEP
jgi:hypothetical protein